MQSKLDKAEQRLYTLSKAGKNKTYSNYQRADELKVMLDTKESQLVEMSSLISIVVYEKDTLIKNLNKEWEYCKKFIND